MTQPSDFQSMPRPKLRAYVLSHRDDDEALRIYMDRLKTEPGVVRYQGQVTPGDLAQLERLLQQSSIQSGEMS